jgi:hypothetical protein
LQKDLLLIRGGVNSESLSVVGPATIQTGTVPVQASIVGEQVATVLGGPTAGLIVDGADVYIRNVSFTNSGGVGVTAKNAGVLRLEKVTVSDNSGGGILIDSAHFDLANTTITANGPGDIMGFPWGGLRIQSVPSGTPATLRFMTVTSNHQVGISCDAPVSADSVLAAANSGGVDVATPCAFTACTAASTSCGAQ